jgi:hypothetical protein
MTKTTMAMGFALCVALALGGCGKSDGGGATCGPLKATLDGKPIEGLTTGFGVKDTAGYSITVFNHDKTTCEMMLAGARQVPDGEQSVTVSAGGQFGAGISYDANTQMGKKISGTLKTKPEKAGDPMAICIKGSFDLSIGEAKGKKLSVEGEVTGQYCGERK